MESAVYQDVFSSRLPACRLYHSWKHSSGSPSLVDCTGRLPTFRFDDGEFRDFLCTLRCVHYEAIFVSSSSESELTGTQFGVTEPLPGCVLSKLTLMRGTLTLMRVCFIGRRGCHPTQFEYHAAFKHVGVCCPQTAQIGPCVIGRELE